nr:hypothetical protein [Tanacetum cinerariifolium]
CGRQILNPNPLQTIIKGVANIVERPVAKLVKFIDPHQSVFLVLVLVDKSSRVQMSRICFTSPQIGSVHVRLRKFDPLLVAFYYQLKVFHSPLDDNAPVNILRETLKARRSSTVRLDSFPCTRSSSISSMSWRRSLLKSPSLNL